MDTGINVLLCVFVCVCMVRYLDRFYLIIEKTEIYSGYNINEVTNRQFYNKWLPTIKSD